MIWVEMNIKLPLEVELIIDKLYKNGYEGFAVGGCIRDSILGLEPKDWDITTSSTPDQTKELFNSLGYKVIETGIQHGTVTIIINKMPYEITTYRVEGDYIDNRRPSKVYYTSKLEEDLKRRDFTINTFAYNYKVGLVDCFNGIKDLNCKKIKAVGDGNERFQEDALRMLRAIRFSSQLDFSIDDYTEEAIINNSKLLKNISIERIREEFKKILISDIPSKGIRKLIELNLMEYIIPELIELVDFNQRSKYHDKDIFNHVMEALDNTNNDFNLRLATLLHDIGKPNTFTIDNSGRGHFYGHELVGEKLTIEILKKLKFDNNTINRVSKLVKNHMKVPQIDKPIKIKKYINEIGEENLDILFQLMIADRKASSPEYRKYDDILKLKRACDKILNSKEPLTLKDININGKDLISLGIAEGENIGILLKYLLELLLEKPNLNTKEILIQEARVYAKNHL
jgi:tRNA nucleotidyltransferase (CCA-adding enzyme)